jgi:hypothetical protein
MLGPAGRVARRTLAAPIATAPAVAVPMAARRVGWRTARRVARRRY